MPPHVPRKRHSPPSSPAEPRPKRVARGPRKGKQESVFDAVEASKPPVHDDERKKFLEQLSSSGSDSSSLSDAEDTADEQRPKSSLSKASKKASGNKQTSRINRTQSEEESSGEDEGDDEEEEGWDDFLKEHNQNKTHEDKQKGDGTSAAKLEITLDKAAQIRRSDIKTSNEKKGPSKIERQIRNSTHQLHVMSLMYHNHMRNHWINDKKLQETLMKHLSEGCKDEVERWKKACGNTFERQDEPEPVEANRDSKVKSRLEAKAKAGKSHKNIRDWGPKANEGEEGNPNLSHGDPTLRLLKTLSAFWRKRFNRIAPGLRKQGYKDMERIQEELKYFRENPDDQNNFGERVESLSQFRALAQKAEGSRDVGAQLFTALLRGLGVKARMVASLQPAGFGWSKGEEASARKIPGQKNDSPKKNLESKQGPTVKRTSAKPRRAAKDERTPSKTQPKRQTKTNADGRKGQPIDLSDSSSPLSDAPDSLSEAESVIDVTAATLTQSRKRYDGDLKYPHYWTEVLSPISNIWIPVDPIVLSVVANNLDSHSVFEPRGSGADHTKQVLAYVVAFNPDGSAKDVTTRYLKRHLWPGKTKGVRYPLEKIPIYNQQGKISKHEQYDWFDEVMTCHRHPEGSAHRSTADALEDGRELKPVHPQRNNTSTVKEPQESLQYYKNSAEFVLERHLRREEALLPSAQAVKTFRTGKGDAAKDEPVYKRSDVVACKSAESWHKEGRQIQVGQQPLKRVPMRAVTAVRKAEVEQAERETGEKMLQALFSREQTEWIIPPPIEDGVIPKNAFGNMDVYVPTMVPEGASHVPLRGTPKVCKKLGIDFAEACTGFEFGNRMAVPVLTGVVVAEENRRLVIDAWREEERQRKEKEAKKREKLTLGMWRKFLAGLRVVERVRREYGGTDEAKLQKEVHKEMDAQGKAKRGGGRKSQGKKGRSAADAIDLDADEVDAYVTPKAGFPKAAEDVGGGGFLPNGEDVGETGGGFLPEGMDAEIISGKASQEEDMDGGFVVEEEGLSPANQPRHSLENGSAPKMKSLREQANDTGADDDLGNEETPLGLDGQVDWEEASSGYVKIAMGKTRAPPHSNYSKSDANNTQRKSKTEMSDSSDEGDTPRPMTKKKRGRPKGARQRKNEPASTRSRRVRQKSLSPLTDELESA